MRPHAGPDGKPLPGVAPVAKQQGAYVAASSRLAQRVEISQHHFAIGTSARWPRSGEGAPLRKSGRFKFKGFTAWLLWCVAHIYFLIGFRNRAIVATNWAWNYITFQRGTRLITGMTGSRMEEMPMQKTKEPRIPGVCVVTA